MSWRVRHRWVPGRQRYREDGAASGSIGGIDRAAMHFRNRATDRQAETRAGHGTLGTCPKELLEDALFDARRNTRSLVLDGDRDGIAHKPGGDRDLRAGRRVFRRVLDE